MPLVLHRLTFRLTAALLVALTAARPAPSR
jgi:hypothetical protein